MSASVGKSAIRVDAYDKVTGRANYTDDLCGRDALIAKVVHATVSNGLVKSIDTSEAMKIPGVVRILTCFDAPEHCFATAGHPWTLDPAMQDIADRRLLNQRVRCWGDDIAAVIAVDEVAAMQAVRAIRVEYETYEPILDVFDAMAEGASQLHDAYPGNVLAHSADSGGDFETAITEPGLLKVEGWYETPTVQHCHIETPVVTAHMEAGRIVVTASTQIPHVIRRIVAQAVGVPWGDVRVIKPHIGGGFGNKQDALYEPLCAWLTTQVGGRPVKLEPTREETFLCTRVRHAMKLHLITWVRSDGFPVARKFECWSNQGAYASHGHAVILKLLECFPHLYPCKNWQGDVWTVFTNRPTAGAMRGYGTPQAMFAGEAHTDDIARALGMDPLEYRRRHLLPKGYQDPVTYNINYHDTFAQVLAKGNEVFDYETKFKAYQNQTGPVRRGVGCAVFYYNTAVWPQCLESSSCRMTVNQDGSIEVQTGETEIGQGCDTVFTQMAADSVGVPMEMVHVRTIQDTDITPYGSGAYASRQTYVGGFSIRQTGELLRKKILAHAEVMTRQPAFQLELEDGIIFRKGDGKQLCTLEELARHALYNTDHSVHLTAEYTFHVQNNAFSFGCTFAEVEVDIPMCKVKLLNMVNVHDCGKLVNPALAEAQVHGGMSMAIGYGLAEELKFDTKTGRPLNGNLLDYKLSTCMDHPTLEARFVENADPTHPFGTKALGEPPTCSGAPAIRNAIAHATGVSIDRCPITPHVLYEEFKKAGLI